jgi:MFS family permease
LILRVTDPGDRHRTMTIWSAYMPAGAGLMTLVAAVILPGASWRAVWLVASAASLIMLVALLLRAAPRHELDAQPANRRPDPARDGRGGHLRRVARHCALLSGWLLQRRRGPSWSAPRPGFSCRVPISAA